MPVHHSLPNRFPHYGTVTCLRPGEVLAELGVVVEAEKAASRTPREEWIIAGFDEIQRFVEVHGRAPRHDEDGDEASGTIYVLRSKADIPFVAENRNLVHKIGVTTSKVETRIAGARLEHFKVAGNRWGVFGCFRQDVVMDAVGSTI